MHVDTENIGRSIAYYLQTFLAVLGRMEDHLGETAPEDMLQGCRKKRCP